MAQHIGMTVAETGHLPPTFLVQTFVGGLQLKLEDKEMLAKTDYA